MFMIPMPPTTSEIEAMPAEQQRQGPADRGRGLEQLGLVEDVEVVVVGRRQLVAVAQERGQLGLGRVHLVGLGDADADRADVVAADEVLLHGPDRHHDLVVGVLEARAALRLEDADDLERDAADRDRRAEVARPSRPRSSAVVVPRTATRRSWSTLTSVRNEPCQTS